MHMTGQENSLGFSTLFHTFSSRGYFWRVLNA